MNTEIKRLEAENEQLRDRIEWLESNFLGSDVALLAEWRLTRTEAAMIRALARHQILTKDQLMTALYSRRTDREEPEIKIVDVYICKLRRNLKPFGVTIKTLWGQGFSLDAETRRMLNGTVMEVSRS